MQALNIIATGNKSKGQTTTYPDEAVFGLELLGSLEVVVDEAEASGLASSEVGAELEDEDGVGVLHLVHLGKPLLQLRLHTEKKQNNPEIQARSSGHMRRAYRTGPRSLTLETLARPGWITSSTCKAEGGEAEI